MDAATKFIGGAIGRRVKRAYEERVVPAVSAKQDAMLREQIAIAERYPDLRACLTDNVVFLAGGNRVVPMSSRAKLSLIENGRDGSWVAVASAAVTSGLRVIAFG
jgi:hypothetical protein